MDPLELDPLDVAARTEPDADPGTVAGDAAPLPEATIDPVSDPAMTPLGAESLAAPAVPQVNDPADASLLALIDRLSSLLDRTDLTELEVQVGETGLVLRKPSALAPTPVQVAAPAPAPAPAPTGPATPEAAASNGAAPADAGPPPKPSVKAPLTGIWYGAPAPGSAPYVSAGGEVNTGQVIGLIEAMKLFNEIKSDLAGRVVKVHAEDGKLVKAKQPLIEVEPL
jgi:acetyl-CoA carboxylase biotin carboxyl carrier protein